MKFDLAFVLVDLGDPFFKKAASEMIRSARRAYKGHEMRVVQLSDKKTAHCPEADIILALDHDVAKEQMCQFKGVAIADYALRTENPVIFCDVDMLWQNDGLLGRIPENETCVGLLHRQYPCMPYNTGVVVSVGPFPVFWQNYKAACMTLPEEIREWWGDQLALAPAMLGFAPEAFIELPMEEVAPAIKTLPEAPTNTPAVHFKGDAKQLMVPYARMLDGGQGFEFTRPILVEDALPRETLTRQGWAF